jgi:hypothetical protein
MATIGGARSKRQTANQAVQSDQLALGQAQKGRRQAVRQGRKQISSYKGATRMAVNQIRGQNLGGLRGTPEGRQLQQEYTGRIRSLQQSLPFGLAPLQRDMKSNIASANSDIAKARLGLQQDQQDQASAAAQIQQILSHNQTVKRQGVQSAYNEAMTLIREQAHIIDAVKAKQGRGETLSSSEKHILTTHAYPVTDLEWTQFEQALQAKDGVDGRSARKAVKHLQNALTAGGPQGQIHR